MNLRTPAWMHDRAGHYVLLLAIVAAVCLPNLGAHSLWDRDEGFYCAVSREMLAAGDWVRPTFQRELFAEKPILLFWTQIAAFMAFGVSEFSARLPSALAAGAAVILTYELARTLFGKSTALLSGTVLASCVQFCLQSRAATPDSLLLLFNLATFYFLWLGLQGGQGHWYLLAGISTGLALLTKGPVGLVLPGLALMLFAAWLRNWRWLVGRGIWLGLAATSVVAAPWYVAITLQTDNRYLWEFLGTHNVRRLLEPLQGHSGSVFYPVLGLCIFFAPWSTLLLPVLWQTAAAAFGRIEKLSKVVPPSLERGFAEPQTQGTADMQNNYRYLICWIAAYLGFFSLSATKLPHYVYPAYPAVAMLTARFLDRWCLCLHAAPRIPIIAATAGWAVVGVATGIGIAVAGGALVLPVSGLRVLPGLTAWGAVGALLPAGALVAWLAHKRGRRTTAVVALSASAALFCGVLAAGAPLSLDKLKAPRELAQAIGKEFGKQPARVFCLDYFQPSLVFYLGPDLVRLSDRDQALQLLAQPQATFLILPAPLWEKLRLQVSCPVKVVGENYDFYLDMHVVAVSNHPAP